MPGANIDDTLTDLSYEGLYRIAEFFEKQATIARARAYDLKHYQNQQIKVEAKVEFLKSTPK